ncbi:hypothetical protein LSG25_03310 [Paralcaligenes sp. KSB-10]|uniref:hypothetical protein n=1 Tax=Paralcaligenes sp. KSB-10 TaxID=2901142 RepID=UPI001E43E1B7|nr:hypothetical protein [Paralcaligenes sp. KSB-10]UHL64947.1 hypothetical protein LSG25_03310 [Paralcaligenes sp. KSB-10]
MQYSKTPVLAKFAALAAALALQGAAMAATPATPDSAAQVASGQAAAPQTPSTHSPRMGRHHHDKDMAMWIPGYGPVKQKLVTSLALNANQAKLLEDAQSAQKALRHARWDAMKSARQEKKAQLDAGKVDPHAAQQAMDAVVQKAQGERQQITQKWLAVWDSLDSAQQQKVAAYLKERADKHYKHEGRHHRQHHDSDEHASAPVKAAS